MPGFSADQSLYRSGAQYAGAAFHTAGGEIAPQQLAAAAQISDGQLYWCRLACLYCRYYGYYCWPCFICAWIVSRGGLSTQAQELPA
ncbi:MAG: hypothetical protein H6509_09790 [Bryobacterales bacterium]|nr:hypothetical protein [Bryobacterales bacterium]